MIWHPKSMNNDFAIKRLWVKEFYEGFKMNHSGKLYFFIFTSRRIILTSWIFFGESLPKMIRIWLFWVLQFPSLPYIAIFRPYSETKENVWETLNEIVYTVFWIFLWFKNSESKWTLTMAYIIIWIITINSLFIMIILIFWIIKYLLFPPKSSFWWIKRILILSKLKDVTKSSRQITYNRDISNTSQQKIKIEESKIRKYPQNNLIKAKIYFHA